MLTPRPYQSQAHDAAWDFIRTSTDPCLIEAATGAGKSIIVALLADTIHKHSGKRVLCLCPSGELVEQNGQKMADAGIPHSIFSASLGRKSTRHPIIVGTPGTIKNSLSRFGADIGAIVIDECFTKGTLIDTPKGPVPVEFMRSGDYVYNATGVGRVKCVMSKPSKDIYEVSLSDGRKIRCTGNHPFFTGMGWKPASALGRGEVLLRKEDMHALWGCLSTQTAQAQGQEADLSKAGKGLGFSGNLQRILCQEIEEPNAFGGEQAENGCDLEAYRAYACDFWGQWHRDERGTRGSVESTGRWVEGGVYSEDVQKALAGLPTPLQDRLGQRSVDDSHRGGRCQPLKFGKKGAGRKENGTSDLVRVESVSRIQCGSDEVVYNLSVSGHPSYFAGGVLVHNCHGTTPTLIRIVDRIREMNPNVRVVGMTATPYRLGTGYIFKMRPDNTPVPEHQTKDPFFTKLVYRITAHSLLEQGYLTPVKIGAIGASKYDTAGLELGRNGQFTAASLDRAYNGHGRKTAGIVADVVAQSRDRKSVMLFCATVQHAEETMASLPPEMSALVTGNTSKDDRARIIAKFKAGRIKYLVNVSVLTTGFDAPSVDVIALLRKTESPGLLQQIIGRGLRLCDEKDNCLLLDYSDNVECHFPDGDIFAPDIKVGLSSGEMPDLDCTCPECGITNTFKQRKNPDGYEWDKHGYFLDLAGDQIMSDYGPIPAHTGRRCTALVKSGATWERCGYRWTSKDCGACGEPNDIAARYCFSCKNELVDPGEKLRLEFKALKRDPTKVQTDKVIEMEVAKIINRKGKEMFKVTWLSEFRSFQTHHFASPDTQWQYADYERLMSATKGLKEKPDTVTYQKDANSGFYKVIAFGRPEDKLDISPKMA